MSSPDAHWRASLQSAPPVHEPNRCHMDYYRTSLLVGSFLLFQVPLAAQVQAVLGQGNVSCSSWLENRQDVAQVAARTGWFLGYITAFNQYGSKPDERGGVSGGRDTRDIIAWIDEYCKEHASENVYRASAALVGQLRGSAGR